MSKVWVCSSWDGDHETVHAVFSDEDRAREACGIYHWNATALDLDPAIQLPPHLGWKAYFIQVLRGQVYVYPEHNPPREEWRMTKETAHGSFWCSGEAHARSMGEEKMRALFGQEGSGV